jgi:hypothetical protein
VIVLMPWQTVGNVGAVVALHCDELDPEDPAVRVTPQVAWPLLFSV